MLRSIVSRSNVFALLKSLVRMALWLALCTSGSALAASKSHIVTFGKWTSVQWLPADEGASHSNPVILKVRPLLVDARVREFTLGPAHDVTDRLFVVRRAFRVNDSLPQESASTLRWQWQRGGWLLVDRVTGRVSPLALPEFDAFYSVASWYRDYAAYCGVSDDGKKVYAVVAQISRRKPVLKKLLEGNSVTPAEWKETAPDSACSAPAWQRAPVRVSFEPVAGPKETFAVRGRVVDLITTIEEEDDEEATK